MVELEKYKNDGWGLSKKCFEDIYEIIKKLKIITLIMNKNSNNISNRKNIISFNEKEIICEFYNIEFLNTIKKTYEITKESKYVPNIKFIDNKTITPYCGKSLDNVINLSINDKIKIKTQIIEFINFIFSVNVVHRDLHIKNICWDGNQIWVIDWEISTQYKFNDILEHYDLTGQGLASPYKSGNMNIFSNNKFSLVKWLKPVELKISEFKIKKNMNLGHM